MTQHALHGAANILSHLASGAEAVVFINSPCFDAGPIRTTLEHETLPG
jgi:hypothetical protein